MKRALFLVAGVSLLFVAGCGTIYPSESRIVSRYWAGTPFMTQFQGDLPPDTTPVPYCYNTLGKVDCHPRPLTDSNAGSYVNTYTGPGTGVRAGGSTSSAGTQGSAGMQDQSEAGQASSSGEASAAN